MAPAGASRLRHSHGPSGDDGKLSSALVFFAVAAVSALATYFVLSPLIWQQRQEEGSMTASLSRSLGGFGQRLEAIREEKAACCRGIEHQELWGSVVAWGSSHKTNSSAACCQACRAMCPPDGDSCKCNSWVFCGDRLKCGSRYGECWLKNQDDPLAPDIQDSSSEVYWTSGLVHGKGMGVVQLQTEHGSIRLKLLPDCAPLSVAFILDLLKLRHCAGCNFFRAEGRGKAWDKHGNPISSKVPHKPPQALLQGTLEAEGMGFKEIQRESCPSIRRGMVGWIDGGPDFFISLANRQEWYPKHTVFAQVLSDEDMHVVETLANLPTKHALWSGVDVALLVKPVSFKLTRAAAASSS